MKKTIINTLVAALAILTAASCAKEIQPASEGEANGARVLTASFAAADTKSTLDGQTPKWAENDVVKLTDGTNIQDFTLVTSEPGANQAKITDEGAKFAVTIPDGWGSTIYAVYPASAYSSISSGNIVITIPTTQDGSFASANICVAKTDGATLSFKNATAILKIEGKTSTISSIEIPATGIAGTYTISGLDGTPSASVSSGANKITLSGMSGSGPFYVAAAPVSIPASTKLTYKDSGSDEVGSRTTSASNTLEINKIYNVGPAVPYGAIPGLFSVSATKKVAFSKGNLQATYSTSTSSYTWDFAANQYDYIGKAAGNKSIDSQSDGAKVDLFGWTATAKGYTDGIKQYGINTSQTDADYGSSTSDELSDWGTLMGTGWRTLSKDEWTYLIKTRSASTVNSTANARYMKCKVNSISGLLLFPDSFTWPTGSDAPAESTATQVNGTDNFTVTYTLAQFATLEVAGAVFLPAGGFRYGSTVDYAGSRSSYWSSTPSTTSSKNAYNLTFGSGSVNTAGNDLRYYGRSVRLVAE